MADQWEMCIVKDENIEIYSPSGQTWLSKDGYIRKFRPSYVEPKTNFFQFEKQKIEKNGQFYRLFLAEGWEPYATTTTPYLHYFHRKYQE